VQGKYLGPLVLVHVDQDAVFVVLVHVDQNAIFDDLVRADQLNENDEMLGKKRAANPVTKGVLPLGQDW